MRVKFCLIIIFLSLFSHTGFLLLKQKGRVYINQSIGWRIEIPPKWSIEDNNSHKRELKDDTLFILDSIEKETAKGVPLSLLQFSKNKQNRFDAVIERSSGNQSVEEKTSKMASLMVRSLNQRELDSELSQEKKMISEIEFESLTIKILDNSGDTELTQRIFMTSIKEGYILIVSLSSTKEKFATELETAFLNSNFE